MSDSGIFIIEDAARARDAGADAVLIGQALMQSDDPEAFVRELHAL